MTFTHKVAGLGFIIILSSVLAVQLSGILNTESSSRISLPSNLYTILITSNTKWMVTGTIDTDQDCLPVVVSELRGTYMYQNFRNPQEIYLIICRMDSGLVENGFFKVVLLKGSKVLLIEESRDFTFEFKWQKSK